MTIKILDCFPYWKEYAQVTARRDLWALYPEYDVTMIAMVGTHTHSGSLITITDSIREGTENGIITFHIDLSSPNMGSWDRERLQRDSLKDKILELGNSEYLVISSDADELVNPEFINEIYKAACSYSYVTLEMVLLYYSIHTASITPWLHPKAFMWDNCPNSLSDTRTSLSVYVQPNCGWHISWQGGKEARETKAKSYAHTEHSTLEEISKIENLVINSCDFSEIQLIPYNQTLLPYPLIERLS